MQLFQPLQPLPAEVLWYLNDFSLLLPYLSHHYGIHKPFSLVATSVSLLFHYFFWLMSLLLLLHLNPSEKRALQVRKTSLQVQNTSLQMENTSLNVTKTFL